MPIIHAIGGKLPKIADDVFVADDAVVLGDTTIGRSSSIWFGAVLRGDIGWIRVGERTNIQDRAVIHMSDHTNADIGNEVTVGHAAVIHGARILDGALIGMGAIILDEAEVGEEALVAAGSLVPPRMKIPRRALVRGNPARIVREIADGEPLLGRDGARHYTEKAAEYRLLRRG
jgi:carbonic anhydrase/acetyltransferase-like protein (isoleucine patch superfamily)